MIDKLKKKDSNIMTEKNTTDKKTKHHVYIPISLLEIIKDRAEKNDRNFSGELCHLLKLALDKEKKK